VAVFTSIQTGSWHTATTWDQGAIPDLAVDDVVVSAGHTVTFGAGQYASLYPGRFILVVGGGTLRVLGALDAYNSEIIVLGTLTSEGDYLYVWAGSLLTVYPGGTLSVVSGFYLSSSATAIIQGQMTIQSSGLADIFDYGVLTVDVGGTIQTYGYCYIEWNGRGVVRDDFSIETSGTLNLYDSPVVTIETSGAVFDYGTFSVSWNARCEVIGYLGVASTGLLSVASTGLINVYKDIRVGGRLTGGGKIVMLRREGRILDFNENPVFVLDRAYGYSKALVA
jgi:hypothetical protein